MSVRTLAARPGSLGSRRIRGWIGLLALEALAVVGYFAVAPGDVGAVRYVIYPFVWINAGLWAVIRTSPETSGRTLRLLGIVVGVAYFLAVMAVPGKIGLGMAADVGVRVGWYVPGWGPLVALTSPWIRLFLVPFEVIGYAGLSYLVYANALRLARGTLSGGLGLITCVGCTVPVLAPLVGLLGGPASSLTTTAYAWSYDVGTLVFLATIGLLYASHEGKLPWR
jgi:hypothetical protein